MSRLVIRLSGRISTPTGRVKEGNFNILTDDGYSVLAARQIMDDLVPTFRLD